MNQQRIDDIKNSLRDIMQLLVQRGQPLTEELRNRLYQVLEHAASRIAQLREEGEPQGPPEQPPSPIAPTTPPGAPSADAQLLWILAGQNEQAFLQYLTNFPTPETQNLLRNPAQLQSVIDRLTQMLPPGEPLVIDGIEQAPLNSSNIWGMAYNPATRQMKVRFQSGSEYIYDGIPPNIYRAFSNGQAAATTEGSNEFGAWWVGKNPSLGAALNQYVKAGGFPYQRIN